MSEANGDDASVQTVVNILMDHATFEQELARQSVTQKPLTLKENEEPDEQDTEESDTADIEGLTPRRCETLSGLPLSPQSAFDAAIRGHIRRVVFSTGTLDFTMSSKTRLFTGPKRLGLIMRDRHCRGPGCDTPAHRCEGDHIREFSRGGETVPLNGEMLCGPCHRWKTKMQALGCWPEIVSLQQTSLTQASLKQTEHLRAA